MSRFFSQNMDYGHTKYLDALMGQKAAVVKALERLEKRTSEVCGLVSFSFTLELVLILACHHRSSTSNRNGSNGSARFKMKKKLRGRRNRRKSNWKLLCLDGIGRLHNFECGIGGRKRIRRGMMHIWSRFIRRGWLRRRGMEMRRMMGMKWIGIRLRMCWRIVEGATLVC